MQAGASFLSAALKKQTKSGFYIQLHVGSAATEPSSEMSSSSSSSSSVCLQLPRWRTSATNPVWRWLYPPSTAMLTAHLASPPEGITELEQKGSAHALVHLCRRLQVHLFTGMPFPVTISEDKGQNATLLLPQANTGEESPTCWSCEQPPRFVLKGLCCCLILFCKWASANFHSVRTSKFYVCNSWLVKRK